MQDLATPSSLELGVLVTQLGGGLALFLFGMRQMTESLKTVAGGGMKDVLAMLTRNRFTAALAGALVTAVIQSSSVTTVLIVGFISAGLMNLSQAVGVILGANVGTTITAQIIAFQVYKYGLLMIAVGFFTEILARRERLRQWGIAVMGLGLIFFGMELMSIATGPLRSWPPFIAVMQEMRNPLLAVAVGAMFTAIVQSSSATTGIVIVLASQALISLETGIGLILGANVGTCVTAFISAVGRPREALQAAWAHVIFNVLGALLWVFFIPYLAEAVRAISPVSSELAGIEQLAADTPRQVANAHTIFNVANLLLFIWFTRPLARLVERIVPERPVPPGLKPKYLDELFLEQPALALDQARRELVRLGEHVATMIRGLQKTTLSGSEKELDALERADEQVDALYEAIVRFLGRLSQKNLVADQPQQMHDYIGICNYLENIGDVIEKDLVATARKRLRKRVAFSPETENVLRSLHDQVCTAFDDAMRAIDTGDQATALEAIESKQAVTDLVDEAMTHIAKNLAAVEPERFERYQIATDIVDNYRRLNTLTRRIAKLAIDARVTEVEDAA